MWELIMQPWLHSSATQSLSIIRTTMLDTCFSYSPNSSHLFSKTLFHFFPHAQFPSLLRSNSNLKIYFTCTWVINQTTGTYSINTSHTVENMHAVSKIRKNLHRSDVQQFVLTLQTSQMFRDPLVQIKLHLICTVLLNVFQSSPSKVVPGKSH